MTELTHLQALEPIARQLEPNAEAREALRKPIIEHGENFLNSLKSERAYIQTETQGSGIYDSPIQEEAENLPELLELIKREVDTPGLHPASAGHLAYIPGGGIYPSALGDYLADVVNHYAGVFFGSPGAVRLENMLIRWLCEVMGLPETAGGNLTSGGSIANLMGIVTARDASDIPAKDFHRITIYLTEQVHHCVTKAVRIAGLREANLRFVPMDEGFRMSVADLERMIEEDKENGLLPLMIVASAGTTDVGAVDPLAEIAAVSKRFGIWFHVDAAYGGFFRLCPEGADALQAISEADSVVVDPHKGLFLPYGTGALLIRDVQKLYRSHQYQANYMQDAQETMVEFSPADLSPELTKHFRGLRLWFPLKIFGLKPFRAALSEKIWLTRYFYTKIQEIEGAEVGPYPELSVMMFRFVPKEGDANELNKRLIKAIHADGRVFLSSTMVDGKFFIRLAVLCFRTHLDTIELCLQVIRDNLAKI